MSPLGYLDILILIVHVVICCLLIGIVLIQGGKGASLSATFGMGSSSAFGSQTDSLLVKWTRNVAIAFLVTTVALTFSGRATDSLTQRSEVPQGTDAAVPSPMPAGQPQAEGTAPAEAATGTVEESATTTSGQ